jgi:predicted RNase H-like nuclease (RuvC/YqgF family)
LNKDGELSGYEAARGKAIQAAIKKDKVDESKTKQLLQASAQLLKEHQNSIKLMEKKDAQIQKLLEENNKLSSTVEEMSTAFKKLEEVNTLNARLFYENQVLKSASLNERQKTHIVEAISKADSVSEAKTMFETLINSVGGPAKEERSPKSLNEAINKKSSFRLPHKQTEQPNDPNKDRWLKLAGIK